MTSRTRAVAHTRRFSDRRSAPLGIVVALSWLAATVLGNLLLVRYWPTEQASWSNAATRTAFAYFGWGWFVTFAILIAISLAACLLLHWSRPPAAWLPWALPLTALLVTLSLDICFRLFTRTQYVTAAGTAEAARQANVASLMTLTLAVLITAPLGLLLRKKDSTPHT
ncbi:MULTISPECIES: hypothetical protein [unclassified Curtobacterium]|uniref:hypothetical protein n=1 Tax=unclassified Curtobacterium TaxID=257496 RepID=UPI00111468B7|nr:MULTISPECIES: hypothetical protein [unclassified Curtobacterium]WIA97006.1 hypothetical protein QOL16_01055 [Curtobacterium sp. MCBA15_004]WIB00313.1 hypothetical protein QOL15_01090 [Curtobacterium sp. MCBA15_012]